MLVPISFSPLPAFLRLSVICLQRAHDSGRTRKPHPHGSPNRHLGVCCYGIPSAHCVLEQTRWEQILFFSKKGPQKGEICVWNIFFCAYTYLHLRNLVSLSWSSNTCVRRSTWNMSVFGHIWAFLSLYACSLQHSFDLSALCNVRVCAQNTFATVKPLLCILCIAVGFITRPSGWTWCLTACFFSNWSWISMGALASLWVIALRCWNRYD